MSKSHHSYRGSAPYDPWEKRQGTARIRREYPEASGSFRPRFNNRNTAEGGTLPAAPPPPIRVIVVPDPPLEPKPGVEPVNPVAPATPPGGAAGEGAQTPAA